VNNVQLSSKRMNIRGTIVTHFWILLHLISYSNNNQMVADLGSVHCVVTQQWEKAILLQVKSVSKLVNAHDLV
jgi:hypothetical protein